MMLFMLMLKPDVGWGQCLNNCNELLENYDLDINSGVTDGENAFCKGDVLGWRGIEWTPHILQETQTGCTFQISNSASAVACLRAGGNGVWYESIVQENLTFSTDPYVTYHVRMPVRIIDCGNGHNVDHARFFVRTGVASFSNLQSCRNVTPGHSTSGTTLLMDHYVNHTNVVDYCVDFQPTPGHDFIWIRSYRPENGDEKPYSVLGVESVNMTCTTTALTDITTTQNSDLNYTFGTVNSSSMSTFQTYSWTITNTATNTPVFSSSDASPSVTFPGEGTYNVCIKIVDNNGCCATRCEEVVVECDDPIATFTLQGTCPNYTFVPAVLDENLTYIWAVNGNVVGNNGVQSYSFTENGTYTIELAVTNECGEKAIVSITITVDCICFPPNSNFSFSLTCINDNGKVDFVVQNGQVGDTYSWNFGDQVTMTTSQTTISHTYTSNQNFIVTLLITNACGETKQIVRNVIVVCRNLCPQNDNNVEYTINGSIGETFSQALSNAGVSINSNNINPFIKINFVLIGDVVMDISAYFDGCKFIALPGAQLILDPAPVSGVFGNKGSSEFIGCQFFGCGYMWKGIRDEGASATFNGGTISDALFGFHAANSGQIAFNGVEFSRNFVGIYMTSSPTHSFSGNNFIGGTLKSAYNGMPMYGNKKLAGIYAQGSYYDVSGAWISGVNHLDVGSINGAPNIFSGINNGIISNGCWVVDIKNNTFQDLNNSSDTNDGSLATLSSGNGICIYGGGVFGVSMEKNVFKNLFNGILLNNLYFGGADVTDHNQFIGCTTGIKYKGGGFFSSKLKVENMNNFNCKLRGIYCTDSYGPSVDIIGNDFNLSSSFVVEAGSSGIKINSLSGGFFGRIGVGNILGNTFNFSTIWNTNGMVEVSKYKNITIGGINQFYFYVHSNQGQLGHGGIYLSEVDEAQINNNWFENRTNTTTFSGHNTLQNVGKSAVTCNYSSGLSNGFKFSFAGTGTSNFLQNDMVDNEIGILLADNCAIGDQWDKGNEWSGTTRIAKLSNANGSKNQFYANPKYPVFWPDQLPFPWFIKTNNVIIDLCSLGEEIKAPLAGINSESTPTISEINTLEAMLDNSHILNNEAVDAGKWAKERWLYSFLTDFPSYINSSAKLSTFFAEVPEDVTSFEDFYKAIYTRFSADNGSINVLNTYQVQAKTVKDNHTTHLEAYKGQPSMSLASDMHADYEYLNEITQMAVTELEAHKTGLDAFLTGMQVLAENLPDDSPHTASAKSYARIFVDFLKHGDSYVSTHHLGELEYLASLCEPLHRETVTLAKNMLSRLGFDAETNDNCLLPIEERRQIIRQNAEVAVTPNPTTGIVQLKASQEITDVVVKSSDGKILKAFVGNMQEIELGDLPNGVYFIGIRTDEGSQTIKKIIKIK